MTAIIMVIITITPMRATTTTPTTSSSTTAAVGRLGRLVQRPLHALGDKLRERPDIDVNAGAVERR